MATKKQIAANRRNALKSTGPRTDAGKAFSRLNALRHGLRAKSGVLTAESLAELNQIRGYFLHLLQPQNPAQVRLVEQMAHAHWQLLNCQRAETQFFSQPSQDPLYQARIMDLFSRRQTRHHRAFSEALHQFGQSTSACPQPEPRPLLDVA